jgi:phosphoribosylformimino-5-aminoimidazole carboxamide ribotide isomerase
MKQERVMEVIPVIDLKGGAVVRARLGQRDAYAPIITPLAATCAPADVVAGLLRLYPFSTLYVADLDAIESRGGHEQTLAALSAAFPEVTLWVDAGVSSVDESRVWLARHPRAHLVLGSETLRSLAPLEQLGKEDRILLSLDFRGESFLGPEALYATPDLWPSRVIVMTLSRVGGHAGPDMERLAAIAARASASKLYAAGGLRGPSDLKRLTQAGVQGVLVASALHDGYLTGADLAAISESAREIAK